MRSNSTISADLAVWTGVNPNNSQIVLVIDNAKFEKKQLNYKDIRLMTE